MEIISWFRENGGYVHDDLQIKWSKDKGYHMQGNFKPRELIIEVPSNLLINTKSLDTSEDSHAALTKYLCCTDNVWTRSIERASLPLFWPNPHLPYPYQNKLAKQQAQIESSFQSSDLEDFDRYRWAWAAVNSRCLYWDVGRDREHQMTLAPVVDFFNHSTDSTQCIAIKRKLGRMQVFAPETPTDELNLFYGPHENAFLLVEYGFVPEENPYDYIDITQQIQKLAINREQLALHGFDGEYSLNGEGPCFRTIIALCSISGPISRYVQGLDDPPSFDHVLEPLYQQLQQEFAAAPPGLESLYAGYNKILARLAPVPK